VITYAGLARLVAVIAGVLSGKLPPGHVAVRAMAAALIELRALADADHLPGAPDMKPAVGFAGRSLWVHRCGKVGLGLQDGVPPEYCDQCHLTGGWERLYVNTAERPH
jgi:hypothetical protein